MPFFFTLEFVVAGGSKETKDKYCETQIITCLLCTSH